MSDQPTVYIITNSYPEQKVMFSTYEFEFLLGNYNNFKILSFSSFKDEKLKNKGVVHLSLIEGIKEVFFPKKIKKFTTHLKMFRYIKSSTLIELGKNIYSYLLALSILRNFYITEKDLIFSYWLTRSSTIAFYLNKLINIRYVCQGHGSDIYIYPPQNIQNILKDAKQVITVANKNKQFLCEKYNIPEEKVKVFRLGVSNDFYNEVLENQNTKLNKESKVRFITIARYEDVKGIDLLLEAIDILVENNDITEGVKFIIYGDGKKYQYYRSYIKERELQNYISLNKWIDRNKLSLELNKADAYILPSRSEGLPVVLMEACSAALPIIATDVGSVSEIAIEGYNAILCDKPNADAISKSIKRFLNLDEVNKEKLSYNSSELFKKDYSLEKNIKEKYDYISRIK